MTVNLNSSKQDREMEALDILLKGKSDDYKGRVLEFVRRFKVDGNDPIFLLMAALGNLDIALLDLPKVIEDGGKDLRKKIDLIITDFRIVCETAKKESQLQNDTVKTALNELRTKIDAVITAENRIVEQLDRVSIAASETRELLESSQDEYKTYVSSAGRKFARLLDRADGLADTFVRMEQRDLISPWDITQWKSQQWITAIGVAIVLLFMGLDSWRTHSEMSQMREDLRSSNDTVRDISEKVGYNTVKLGRIEKYLGIKRTK
jgi:hypothetical protein